MKINSKCTLISIHSKSVKQVSCSIESSHVYEKSNCERSSFYCTREKELYCLDNSKVPGHGNISISSKDDCDKGLYIPLTYIFNSSIRACVSLDHMKLAMACLIKRLQKSLKN